MRSRVLGWAGFWRRQALGSQVWGEFKRFRTGRSGNMRLQTVDQDNQENQTQ